MNLITGNRSRLPSVNSNPKVESQEEYRKRRRRNNENKSEVNGVIGLAGVANAVNNIVVASPDLENTIKKEITNEIIELTDTFSYSGHQVGNSQNKQNGSALSTPVSRHTPMVQMNNMIQSNASVHRPEPQQINTEQLQQMQQLQQLQQLQNLQQYFNSQQQVQTPTISAISSIPNIASLPIPQLVPQASTPRIHTPMPNVVPSNASNRSNTPIVSNLQTQGTDSVLNAVSANLVYAAATLSENINRSQNITPATSKPASVKGDSEHEAIALPHSYFVSNVVVPDSSNIQEEEEEVKVALNSDNIIIDILPLTQNNLNIHENVMLQHQSSHTNQNETIVSIPALTQSAALPPLLFDALDPDGMM